MPNQLRLQPAVLDHLDNDIKQALTVHLDTAGGCRAALTAWELRDGRWQHFLSTEAAIGRSGFVAADEKREGDGGTPTGTYPLSLVFGYGAEAGTAMPYRQITADDYWVDDPASPQYNTWVRGRPAAASFETMLRPDGLYRHGIVVEYNSRPVVAGKGSAIFVHIWRGAGEPTAGCVALAEGELREITAWLDPEKGPVIVLGGR
jgi:L,D-peptidoglycan transpeptidase YkuD (ErfK/YbiS/YcfS/YnhG family)